MALHNKVNYCADHCYIADESSIKNHTASDPGLDSNLDPFTAYCLFLTSQATSIDLAPMKENTTMTMLYNISEIAYAKLLDKDASVIELLNKFNDNCTLTALYSKKKNRPLVLERL